MSLRRDKGCIYLCFLLRPVGFFFSKILHLCHLGATKSACPTAAEKCLPTAICPHSRWRSQLLSRVSRKQRYNTLDFAKQNRVPTGMLRAPIGNPVQKGIFPLQSLIFFAGAYANCKSNSLKIKKRCNLRHIIGRKLQRFITLNVNKKWAAISTALI